jgi:hypothetical protein
MAIMMNINPIYTSKGVMQEMKKTIENELVIALPGFFKEDLTIIKNKLKTAPFEKKYNPLMHSYSELNLNQVYDIDIIAFVEFFKGKDFLKFIEELTNFDLQIGQVSVRKYAHSDFILLNDYQKNDDCFDITFDIADQFSDKMGGTCVYTTQEEEILYLDPSKNILTVLYKSPSIKKYLKYINAKAKDKQIFRIEIKAEFIEESLTE